MKRRTTPAKLDAAYAQFRADRDQEALFAVLHDYVSWINWRVPIDSDHGGAGREDLVQIVCLAIHKRLHTFEVDRCFSKWVNSYNEFQRANFMRKSHLRKQTFPGTELQDGIHKHDSPDEPELDLDDIDPERAAKSRLRLDIIEAGLKGKPLRLFRMLRAGKSIPECAAKLGEGYTTTLERFRRMQHVILGQKHRPNRNDHKGQ